MRGGARAKERSNGEDLGYRHIAARCGSRRSTTDATGFAIVAEDGRLQTVAGFVDAAPMH
ncbi:MAG: hypothetical protein BGO98_15450 [Myxococcales bacterium 68-20]|nr:MAG: hypothetical protein BGO98_15450 [Myxococcales bacterium 68-20]